MHKALLIMAALGGVSAVHAQPTQDVAPQRDADAQMTSAQKRMELRKVLSAGRRADPTEQADSAGRQLSEHERAEMREQLRRQPPVAPRAQRP